MDTRSLSTLANTGAIAECACHDSAATFMIDNREFVGQFDGNISVRLGKPLISPDRLTTVPLHLIGYTTSSDVPGMGRTTLDLDFSRPIPVSDVTASREQEFFPAVQTMRLQILATTEAFKGRLLRSVSPGILRNANAHDFPPPVGSTYSLEAPVDLEDVASPGVRLATLKNVNTSITSTQVLPGRITTNSVFFLHARAGKTVVLSEERGDIEIAFETTSGGSVALELFDHAERSIGIAAYGVRASGRQAVRITNRLWQGRASYYRISVDGLPRTGLMPIE